MEKGDNFKVKIEVLTELFGNKRTRASIFRVTRNKCQILRVTGECKICGTGNLRKHFKVQGNSLIDFKRTGTLWDDVDFQSLVPFLGLQNQAP